MYEITSPPITAFFSLPFFQLYFRLFSILNFRGLLGPALKFFEFRTRYKQNKLNSYYRKMKTIDIFIHIASINYRTVSIENPPQLLFSLFLVPQAVSQDTHTPSFTIQIEHTHHTLLLSPRNPRLFITRKHINKPRHGPPRQLTNTRVIFTLCEKTVFVFPVPTGPRSSQKSVYLDVRVV